MAYHSKDLQSVFDYFTKRKPVRTDCIELRNLSSGIVAEQSVNIDSAAVVVSKSLTSMDGMFVSKFKYSTKEKVTTFNFSVCISWKREDRNGCQTTLSASCSGLKWHYSCSNCGYDRNNDNLFIVPNVNRITIWGSAFKRTAIFITWEQNCWHFKICSTELSIYCRAFNL